MDWPPGLAARCDALGRMTGLSGGGEVDPVALEMVVAVVASSPLEAEVLVS